MCQVLPDQLGGSGAPGSALHSSRDAPSSSASCTSSIRVGGRSTPLEEAGTCHKKREVWGGMPGESLGINL